MGSQNEVFCLTFIIFVCSSADSIPEIISCLVFSPSSSCNINVLVDGNCVIATCSRNRRIACHLGEDLMKFQLLLLL